MRALVTGLADLEAGRENSWAQAKRRLGLKQSMPEATVRFAESAVADLAAMKRRDAKRKEGSMPPEFP